MQTLASIKSKKMMLWIIVVSTILLILLIVLAYFTIFQGISIGSFKILGTGQIIELNNELTSKIDEANRKIKTDLQAKKNELSQNVDDLLENKESYYRLANISTESQINEANTEEVYNIEYLWLRVGRHARNEGVNMKMDVMNDNSKETNIKNLSFTVVGKYVGIIDFISSLEDDSELNFRIDNFKFLSPKRTDGHDVNAALPRIGIPAREDADQGSRQSHFRIGARYLGVTFLGLFFGFPQTHPGLLDLIVGKFCLYQRITSLF